MVFTLHRYIFRDLLKTFFLATVVLSLVLGLGAMLRPLKQFGVAPERVPELLFYTLPITLTMVIPIAGLLATTLNYGRLAVDNEINACRSSGIGIWTLIYPALTLALLVGLATLLLVFHVVPHFTEKFDSILREDAKAIIFRTIEKTGNLQSFGKKLSKNIINADRVDTENNRLIDVTVVQLNSQREIENIRTASQVYLDFETKAAENRVLLRFIEATNINLHETGLTEYSTEDVTIACDMPSIGKDDIKFRRLRDLQAIQSDLTQFAPIASIFQDLRWQIMKEAFFYDCDQKLKQSDHSLLLRTETDQIRLWAAGGKIKKPKSVKRPKEVISTNFLKNLDETIQVDLFYPNRPNEPTKRYQAEEAKLVVKKQAMADFPVAVLKMNKVKLTFANSSRSSNLEGAEILSIIIPTEFVLQAQQYTFTDFLQARKLPVEQPTVYIEWLFRKLSKACDELKAEIVMEINARLAFGIGCVVMVLLGAALGIVMKSGHFLTAFGVSCIPAVVCLTTIFTGKHIGEQGTRDVLQGLVFLWIGIVIIALANVVLYRKLLKS